MVYKLCAKHCCRSPSKLGFENSIISITNFVGQPSFSNNYLICKSDFSAFV